MKVILVSNHETIVRAKALKVAVEVAHGGVGRRSTPNGGGKSYLCANEKWYGNI